MVRSVKKERKRKEKREREREEKRKEGKGREGKGKKRKEGNAGDKALNSTLSSGGKKRDNLTFYRKCPS